MPRDTALTPATPRPSKRARRLARMAVSRTQRQTPAQIYASADRSRLFNHLNVSERILTRSAFPIERRLFPTIMDCIRAAGVRAAVVLP